MPRDKIPGELRALPQWVCAGANKVPTDPKTGRPASVTDPSAWGTFQEASEYADKNGLRVGFVFTEADPFTGIDLDNKIERPLTPEQWGVHERILNAFETYTERSTSGRGYHVIGRGKVPAGVHSKDGVEVYSSAHYFVMTGDVVRDAPIADCQPLLDHLYGEMKPAPTVELDELPEDPVERDHNDRDLVEMAMTAENADKFDRLSLGDWRAMGYPSQSEADFALLSMLAFYSKNNEQVRRIFRYSNLGKREKATRDNAYLNRSLKKIRASEPPPVGMAALLAQAASVVGGTDPRPPPENLATTEMASPLTCPPGLLGQLAAFFYESAVRPVPEVAMAAALGLMAGVCGRQFNIAGVGLNLYLMVTAKTGRGKSGLEDGIDAIVAAVRPEIPLVDDFIGPGTIASGQALHRVLNETPCFVALLGEFGLTLQQLCHPRANENQVGVRRTLLHLYAKSGQDRTLRGGIYASKDNNINPVTSPALTIACEGTPETFFDAIDEHLVTQGLVSRFLILDYDGARPPRNKRRPTPAPEMLLHLKALLHSVLSMQNSNRVEPVCLAPDAENLLDAFDVECDRRINSSGAVEAELYNRAHLHALKLAALVAVGWNHNGPVVTADHARWAIEFVRGSVRTVLRRFEKGEVGGGDQAKAEAKVRQLIVRFLAMPAEERAKDDKIPVAMHAGPCIPRAYLSEHTRRLQPFKGDKRALENTLEEMVRNGDLQRLSPQEAREKCKTRSGQVYAVGPNWK
ncbi:DUF3987 domain-containing protein [Anaeromyxobacter sp. SG17]|uniref:phage NrS-1 polymerase family protein n=1 Tax=Anaeromyxobacter sp. SG17 TaxID=2925405 RepID=UPI001F5705A8|nr:DUF3987 domain-containing protein [Anaeromyxobacter sp. SG17]